jgi:hypothetical protein
MTRTLLALGAVVLLTGCHAASVHPFLEEKDRVEVAGVAGTWVEAGVEKPVTVAVRPGQGKTWDVVLSGQDGEARFTVAAGLLGKSTYLDVLLHEESPGLKAALPYLVRPHFLVKAKVEGDTLSVWLVDKKWLREQLATKRVKLDHQVLNPGDDGELVLFTATTGQLQQAVRRHLDTPTAWGDPLVLLRQKTGP